MSSDHHPSTSGSFVFPEFWSYPPYFTLQPIPDTQQKQKELWRNLILSYCRHNRIFQISVDDSQDAPPFANPSIQRCLNRDVKVLFLDDLVKQGRGEWLDGKTKRTFLVLWRSYGEWADVVYAWAIDNGLRDSVETVDDVLRGGATAGSELVGMPRTVLLKTIKVLETRGKAKFFSGNKPDEEGVKFF